MAFDFNVFVRIVTKPKEEIPAQLPQASFAKGAKIYLVLGAFWGFLLALMAMMMASIMAFTLPAEIRGIVSALGLAALVVFPVLSGILGVVFSVVSYGILFLVAKLLGGKASFGQFYCLFALVAVPTALLSMVVSVVPFLGFLLSLLVTLYALYLGIQIYKALFGFSTLRAIVAYIVIPLIITIVISLLLVGTLIATLAPLMAGS